MRVCTCFQALGRIEDHAHYGALHSKLRSAYHAAFFDPSSGEYEGNGTHVTQFANLMPLALNITPPTLVPKVLAKLLSSVRSGANGACASGSTPCVATGFWGTRFILQTLTRYGQHALAMELATKTTQPSWGYMVTSNRSVGTLWEAWNGGSLDHIAFGGGIGAWLYSAAGYNRDPWTGQVTLRAIEPWLAGRASVSRHVVGEGLTGWSWCYNNGSYHDDQEKQAKRYQEGWGKAAAARNTRRAFEANVSVPLGRHVEVWLQPPPAIIAPAAATPLAIVVRDQLTGSVLWSERSAAAATVEGKDEKNESESESEEQEQLSGYRYVSVDDENGGGHAAVVVRLPSGDYKLSAAFE